MMRFNRTCVLCCVAALVTLSLACASKNKPAEKNPAVGLNVRPTPTVMAMAQNPTPPANARKVASIGNGTLAVNTANGAEDLDLIWVERIDIDGDGRVDNVQVLYDNVDGVLYFYTQDDVPCRKGGVAN